MNDIYIIINSNDEMWLKYIFKKKNDLTLIVDSFRKYVKYRKIFKGRNEFKIKNFKLLNGETVNIVGDLYFIDFIFTKRGEIGYIGENCGLDEQFKIYKVDECPICCDENNIKYLLCGHGMCGECIKLLLKNDKKSQTCPICREEFGKIGNTITITREKAMELF